MDSMIVFNDREVKPDVSIESQVPVRVVVVVCMRHATHH